MKHSIFSNMFFAALSKCIAIIGPFVVRTIIIYKLGNEYVGLNSLFTSLLNVLNLAELGFGSAMTFYMYKPVNEKDYEKLSGILNFYKFTYRIIGGAILVFGLILTPFIKYLINGNYPDGINIYILFIIYLLNTVASYTLFAYKSSILIANCRNDILHMMQGITQLVMYIIQTVVLMVTKNYYFYIIILPLFTIINNGLIYYTTKKRYPEYIDSGKLAKSEKKLIFGQIKALLVHKLAGVLITSFDNIVISTLLGLGTLAVFSNYFYLVNAINGLVDIVMTSIVSTVGSQILKYSKKQLCEEFYVMSYISNVLIGTCTVCFFCLFQPFISFWVGKEGILPVRTMILFCIYFYTWKIRSIGLVYRDAAGLWKKDATKSMVGVILDLVLDIVLVASIGIDGALISTILITTVVFYPWETKILFTDLFQCSSSRYMFLTIQNAIVTIILLVISWYFLKNIEIHSEILNLFIRLILSMCVSVIGFIISTVKTKEFRMICQWYKKELKGGK